MSTCFFGRLGYNVARQKKKKKKLGQLTQLPDFGETLKEAYFKIQAFLHDQIQAPEVESIVWVLGESQCDVLCCCVNMNNNSIDCVVLFNTHRL